MAEYDLVIRGGTIADGTGGDLIAGDVVPQTGGFRVTWNTIPDRLYTVLFSTNLQAGFMPLPGAVDLPPTVTAFTDPATNSPGRFYKVQVRLP